MQKFKDGYSMKKKTISLQNSSMIFNGLSLVSKVINHAPKRIPDIFEKIAVGCEGYYYWNIKANIKNKTPVKKHDKFIFINRLFWVPNIFLITFLIFSFILRCPLYYMYFYKV